MKRLILLVGLPILVATACNKPSEKPAGSSTATAQAPQAGVIPVTVSEAGFKPDTITLKKGETATLRFTRTTDETCATKVVFPEIKLEKDLPLNTPVDVPIDTKEQRTLAFQCGMGMYKSKVVIE